VYFSVAWFSELVQRICKCGDMSLQIKNCTFWQNAFLHCQIQDV